MPAVYGPAPHICYIFMLMMYRNQTPGDFVSIMLLVDPIREFRKAVRIDFAESWSGPRTGEMPTTSRLPMPRIPF